jgi:hypothetical protein
MDVQIIEIDTARTAATIPVSLARQHRIPSEQDFYAEAWRCAVVDQRVDAQRRGDYRFQLVRPS